MMSPKGFPRRSLGPVPADAPAARRPAWRHGLRRRCRRSAGVGPLVSKMAQDECRLAAHQHGASASRPSSTCRPMPRKSSSPIRPSPTPMVRTARQDLRHRRRPPGRRRCSPSTSRGNGDRRLRDQYRPRHRRADADSPRRAAERVRPGASTIKRHDHPGPATVDSAEDAQRAADMAKGFARQISSTEPPSRARGPAAWSSTR